MVNGRTASVWQNLIRPAYSLFLVVLAWEAAARFASIPPVFLPPFSAVLIKLWEVVLSGELILALATSLFRTGIGLIVAMALGVSAGFLAAQSRFFQWLTGSLVRIGFPMPKIALLPLFTLWFGIEHMSKVTLVAATCFFPFFIAAQSAASEVPQRYLWAARALGTSQAALFARVIFPSSLPSLVSGLRICVPMALITVFTAEMLTGGGIGERIIFAQRFFETSTVFAYLLVTIVVGYIVDDMLARYQRALKQ